MQSTKEREGATSPGLTYMSPRQMRSYLDDLRNNRPARPTGSRPPPAHFKTWSDRSSARLADSPSPSPSAAATFEEAGVEVHDRPPSAPEPKSHRRTTSSMSIDEVIATAGRPLVQPPRGRDMSRTATSTERSPSVQYRESGRRQVERDEVRSIRAQMEELEWKSEERLYNAARDEAAELVWKHINPNAPGTGPEAPYRYPGLARKGSTQRSRSVGPSQEDQDLQRTNSKLRKRNSMGSSTAGSRSSSLQSRRVASGSSVTGNAGYQSRSPSPTKTSFNTNGYPETSAVLPKNSSGSSDQGQRRRSSGSRRKVSASLFKNPDDQIYEEPEEETPASTPVPAPAPAASKPPIAKVPLSARRNPFSRVQFARDHNLVRANTDPVMASQRFNRYEIHHNPPTQSRNAGYTRNTVAPSSKDGAKSDAENEPDAKTKDSKEIRADDIRAATGFKLKDRSTKLPTPTMVSDSPGRPIVSFKKDWAPKEIELKEEISPANPAARPAGHAAGPRPLSKSSTAPAVPTLQDLEPLRRTSPVDLPRESVKKAPITPSNSVPKADASPAGASPSRFNRANTPSINVYEDPPAPARPLPSTSRKVNTPSKDTTAPVPTINVSQAPAARFKPSSAPSIPTISVQDTPSSSARGSFSRGTNVQAPSISVTPSIPTISFNETPSSRPGSRGGAPSNSVTRPIPSISVNEPSSARPSSRGGAPSVSITPSVPSININGSSGSTRPLPNPKDHASRPFGRNGTTNSRSHWTPTTVRTGALCTQCALPIAGRIVSAGGARFHPECFMCHHCGEHLECVAFYPEPDNKHAERVSRIQARQRGEDLPFLDSHPTHDAMLQLEHEDGWDECLRFYCHLDFHELFSPRCKSCKTPIEGEVIVACGAEWHAGHFFCAQCGDPFDSTTPFVEKDGYAWCVNCHTNRYSTKCKKCRKPVTDTVVKALGAEWHMQCFCCMICSGPFEDGRYFLRGESQDPVCVRCEERRLKA